MRNLFLILSVFLISVSCAKFYYSDTNPSYMPVVNIKITADVDRSIKTDIGKDFEENLLYDWDTLKYGKIYSTYFDTVICKVFDSSMKIVDNVEIVSGEEKIINAIYPEYYNFLIYNKTQNTGYYLTDNGFVSGVGFLYEYPDFNFTELHGKINQCEEQFSIYEKDVYSIVEHDPAVIVRNSYRDTLTYYYYINEKTNPISFVYIIQVVIINDDKTIPMLVTRCDYLGVCGVAESKEMTECKNTSVIGTIESNDIKPFQHHDSYSVCCSKIITYGLPENKNSSWSESKYCELGIQFSLSNGKKKRGRVSVANKFLEKPFGGVITVYLNNSEIYKSDDYQDDGINVDVEEWEEYVFDIIF